VYTHKVDIRSREVLLQYSIEDPEIAVLWDVFKKQDKNRNGFWTLSQCFDLILESKQTIVAPLLESLNRLASSCDDASLTFDDMIVSMCSYCAFSSEEIMQFMFITLDSTCTGSVSRRQLEDFYQYAASDTKVLVFPPNNMHALNEFRGGKWPELNFNEYAFLLQSFPQLAFCGFHLQHLLREGLLGLKFWKKWDAERAGLFRLEGRGEICTVSRELPDGRIVRAIKPSAFTMREIQEFTLRRQQLRRAKKLVDTAENGADGKMTLTGMKDERLIFCPLISVARNPGSVYHAHVESELEEKMHAKLLLRAQPRRLTRFLSAELGSAPRQLREDDFFSCVFGSPNVFHAAA